MKINITELSDKNIVSTTNSTKMRLSENAASMVFQLFTKNVYSNPIGTVVREITSNCFDSHIEANVNSPVIIRKNVDDQTGELSISFIDFGVGMSPDRVNNIYGVYFESTKRLDNNQIGGFGIGAKTGLAYKRSTGQGDSEYDNSFYVVTIFDNVKYYYCMYEGADSPIISLLHEEPTTERNGTEVRIPVLARDVDKFTKEMVKQLYYFENIIFEGFGDTNNRYDNGNLLSNTYQIVRGKSFLYRGNDYNENMHICLGRVAYPIDYGVLGLYGNDYKLPIALRLEVGDVNVTVSREAIDYSESTIKMLKAKLEDAKNEIIELLNVQYSNTCSLRDYFDLKNDFGKVVFANGVSLYVGNLIKHDKIKLTNFAYGDLKIPSESRMFEYFFKSKTYGKTNRWDKNFSGGYNDLVKCNNVLYVDGDFNRKLIKQAYLKSLHGSYHIVTKENIFNDVELGSNLRQLFGIQTASSLQDPQVQMVLQMQDEYFDIVKELATDYESVDVPQSFVDGRKRNRAKADVDMLKTVIPLTLVFGNNRNNKFSVTLGDLFKSNVQVFYGTQEDEEVFRQSCKLFEILFNKEQIVNSYNGRNERVKFFNYNKHPTAKEKTSGSDKGIMIIQIAKNNVKYMKYCKNASHVNDFNLKMLYRKEDYVKKCFQNREVAEWYYNLRDFYKDSNFGVLSPVWAAKLKRIADYAIAINKAYDQDMFREKSLLAKFFDLSDTKSSLDELMMKKEIKDVEFMIEANLNVTKYLRLPNDIDKADPEHIALLKKLLIF